ncbi:AAA family ATPase [Pseudoduganella sp. FT26W]|uniref:AAA family ATPase n=1 Tax=Duganella aquatilis TaxID=2666082 RepID=A0A844DCW9_9BURK|nr:ATP-binding protein [Duganella aquatilis]MRW85274.1 AAA family ATPase [Duganella aquatilis]
MIKALHMSNFKSLVQFRLPLPKFTVLIGMNGSGKTTILQAFDFVSQLMEGKVEQWLTSRSWSIGDLASKFSSSTNINGGVVYEWGGETLFWLQSLNRKEMACLTESVSVYKNKNYDTDIFKVKDRHYKIDDKESVPVTFTYQGSLLSQLRDSELTPPLKGLRDALKKIRSLELLSPHLMRQRTRDSTTDIGVGGERLSSFLHSFKGSSKGELLEILRKFYPRVVDFKTSPTKGGWKRLSITEDFDGKYVESEVRHINDGLLRVLALIAQTKTDKSLLLFDEVENGVNPEIVEKLVEILVNATQQIVVTTHSPMILNYLEDDIARHSVMFVYKNPKGITRVRPFFSISGIGEKLEVMGAGEAFVDTDLVDLTKRCVALDEAEEFAQRAKIGKTKA